MDKLKPAQREYLRSIAPNPDDFKLENSTKFPADKSKSKPKKTEVNAINKGQQLLI